MRCMRRRMRVSPSSVGKIRVDTSVWSARARSPARRVTWRRLRSGLAWSQPAARSGPGSTRREAGTASLRTWRPAMASRASCAANRGHGCELHRCAHRLSADDRKGSSSHHASRAVTAVLPADALGSPPTLCSIRRRAESTRSSSTQAPTRVPSPPRREAVTLAPLLTVPPYARPSGRRMTRWARALADAPC